MLCQSSPYTGTVTQQCKSITVYQFMRVSILYFLPLGDFPRQSHGLRAALHNSTHIYILKLQKTLDKIDGKTADAQGLLMVLVRKVVEVFALSVRDSPLRAF